jgi:hypothetical protein
MCFRQRPFPRLLPRRGNNQQGVTGQLSSRARQPRACERPDTCERAVSAASLAALTYRARPALISRQDVCHDCRYQEQDECENQYQRQMSCVCVHKAEQSKELERTVGVPA